MVIYPQVLELQSADSELESADSGADSSADPSADPLKTGVLVWALKLFKRRH